MKKETLKYDIVDLGKSTDAVRRCGEIEAIDLGNEIEYHVYIDQARETADGYDDVIVLVNKTTFCWPEALELYETYMH